VRTLYICYLGLREPLVQSQVLPYLRQLAAAGIEVHLLTFESRLTEARTTNELAAHAARLDRDGINWSYLAYHKRPSVPATLYDVLAGAAKTIRLLRSRKIDVLHARAHIPLAIALLAQRWTGCALIFDLRGLVAEEYADAGLLKENSFLFRTVKRLERAGLRRADQIVVLTKSMRDWLMAKGEAQADRIEVIPTCADFSRFKREEEVFDSPDSFEVIYAGSVVGLYMLKEMARFFLAIKLEQPNAMFRVLTLSDQEEVANVLQRAGVSTADFQVAAVSPEDVPNQIRRARLGISFRRPTFSQIAASPTKIAEYLASGIPIVSNIGTGDVDELFQVEQVGLTVDVFDEATYADAAKRAIALAHEPGIRERCIRTGRRYFDLVNVGGQRYRNVYERLSKEKRGRFLS